MNGSAGEALRAVAVANSRGEGASFQVGSFVQVSAEFLADLVNDRRALATARETLRGQSEDNQRLRELLKQEIDGKTNAVQIIRAKDAELEQLRKSVHGFANMFLELPYSGRRSNKLLVGVRKLKAAANGGSPLANAVVAGTEGKH